MTKISLWQWLPLFKWRVVGVCEEADEIPVKLPRNAAVIVVTGSYKKWIAFDCPCRKGHRIMLSLQREHDPHWTIKSNDKLTISPSIDYRVPGQRCHYFVRNGIIEWT